MGACLTVKRITGRTLQTLRARLFYDHPLCVLCEAKGVLSLSRELDHIIPLFKGGTNDDSNCQAICLDCHKAKTVIDMGYRPRVTIGADGWPVGNDASGTGRGTSIAGAPKP